LPQSFDDFPVGDLRRTIAQRGAATSADSLGIGHDKFSLPFGRPQMPRGSIRCRNGHGVQPASKVKIRQRASFLSFLPSMGSQPPSFGGILG